MISEERLHFYTATCARGLESVLANELKALQVREIKIGAANVQFRASDQEVMKVHFWVRTASRILKPLKTFGAHSADELYNAAIEIPWEKIFGRHLTFSVETVLSNKSKEDLAFLWLKNTHFASLKIKDAICDRFRKATGDRPEVNAKNPHVGIVASFVGGKCIISLDATGRSLHERDYRETQTEAPMKETLASGLLQLAGYNPLRDTLIDPMTGSGTIAIEAASLAQNRAPGLRRRDFCFTNWIGFSPHEFQRLRQEAELAAREAPHKIWALDESARNVQIARQNSLQSGLQDALQWKRMDFTQLTRRHLDLPAVGTEPGLIVCNPPYGERLSAGEDLRHLYSELGRVNRAEFPEFRLGVISANIEALGAIDLRLKEKIIVHNGRIPCEYRIYYSPK